MESAQLEKWRNEVLSRLEALKVRARQIEAAWWQVKDLLPESDASDQVNIENRSLYHAAIRRGRLE